MNNLMLAILLDKYSDLLWEAFDEALEALPAEMKITNKNIMGVEFESAPILQPIWDFLSRMDEDVNELKERVE